MKRTDRCSKLTCTSVLLAMALVGVASMTAFAYGPWLDKTPFGGVEVGGPAALERAELNRRLDAIERATSNAPYIVTRTKSLVEVFDHGRLALNTNDLFVHWHPEKYEDLQVRVCGWNVRWQDLSHAERMHFIATAEAQE